MNKQDLIQAAKEWIADSANFKRLTHNRMHQYNRDVMDCYADFGIIRIQFSDSKTIILIPKTKSRIEEPKTYRFSKHELGDEEYAELKSVYWGDYLHHDPQSHKEAGFAYLNTNPLLLDINKNPAPKRFLSWVKKNNLFAIIILNCIGCNIIFASMQFFHTQYAHWAHWVAAFFCMLISWVLAFSGDE